MALVTLFRRLHRNRRQKIASRKVHRIKWRQIQQFNQSPNRMRTKWVISVHFIIIITITITYRPPTDFRTINSNIRQIQDRQPTVLTAVTKDSIPATFIIITIIVRWSDQTDTLIWCQDKSVYFPFLHSTDVNALLRFTFFFIVFFFMNRFLWLCIQTEFTTDE